MILQTGGEALGEMEDGFSALPDIGESADISGIRNVLISVADNGPGIELTDQQSIFEPFTTTKFSHCGLGLTLARRLVEHQGGTLGVQSNPGEGATFMIMIPLPDEPPPPA